MILCFNTIDISCLLYSSMLRRKWEWKGLYTWLLGHPRVPMGRVSKAPTHYYPTSTHPLSSLKNTLQGPFVQFFFNASCVWNRWVHVSLGRASEDHQGQVQATYEDWMLGDRFGSGWFSHIHCWCLVSIPYNIAEKPGLHLFKALISLLLWQ